MAWISDGPDAASAQEELKKPIKVNFDTGSQSTSFVRMSMAREADRAVVVVFPTSVPHKLASVRPKVEELGTMSRDTYNINQATGSGL